ncbi:MAG: C25 family cysteine peptidase [bacterium]
MKNSVGLVLFVAVFTSFSAAIAGMVTHDYFFDQPVVTWMDDGQWITMRDCRTGGMPGAPALPSYGVRLLLPPGEGIESVRIIAGERRLLGAEFMIPQNQYQVPLSFTGPYEKVAPNPDIYESNRAYPYEFNSKPFAQGYCGHTIGFFTLNPISYNPVTGEVWWYSQMRVEIVTRPESEAQVRLGTLYYRDDRIQGTLERWVDNTETIGLYPPVQQTRQEEYDMVIITNAALQSTFQTYADLKNRRGIRTFVQTTEWIYANVSGSDNQAKIRNYIIECYTSYHIQYVLLGGDGDASGAGRIIPHRGVYARSHYGGGDITDTNLPCDLYYGGLDGTWNTDGDGQYGEETPEEADFIAEVHVGRASVDDVTEANRFINKHTMYQRTPVVGDCDGNGILFAGELLWDDVPGVWTFGDTYMQEVRWGSSNHGYTTVGVDEPAIADTLYDRPFYPGEWSAMTHLRPKLNDGCNVLHHLGHCSETYMARFYDTQITDANLTNNGTNHNFYIMYSQGCYPGSFEYNDCITEKWTVGINNGAVAAVTNSRYGWGYHMSTRGSS